MKRMKQMFFNCKKLRALDVSSFDTAQVETMHWMFSNCESVTELNLAHFNTSQVTDMELMFSGCKSLKSLDVSSFDTARVTTMERMFEDCRALKSLDVSSFDTARVTTMERMFAGCASLAQMDLSSFTLIPEVDLEDMFKGCEALREVHVSDTILRTTCHVKNVKKEYPFRDYSGPLEYDEGGNPYIPGEGNSPSQAYYNRIMLDRDYCREVITYAHIPFARATDEQRRAYLGLHRDVKLTIVPHGSRAREGFLCAAVPADRRQEPHGSRVREGFLGRILNRK